MSKRIEYKEDARRALERGVNAVANAVKVNYTCSKGYIKTNVETLLHDIKTRRVCNN